MGYQSQATGTWNDDVIYMYRVQIHNSLQYGVKVHMLYRCKLSKLT